MIWVYVVLSVAAFAAFWAGWGVCLIANPALAGRHRRGREQDAEITDWLTS